jgi:predicted Zn finger-like uncharacterized protein
VKFLCDRCKTRYSIGDDRVRGKILKIRCKNCANVITVREGMPEPDAVPVAAGAPRRNKTTTAAPEVESSTATAQGGALGAAFANAMSKPPPALEEEWYVSIDGDQSGPFTLGEAQRWVGSKPFDAELHCWSEGFDDWLPVDKVSHFRGLRKKAAPPPVAAPPPLPRIGTGPARAISTAARIPDEEHTPKPLFAATMASLEKSAAAVAVTGASAGGAAAVGALRVESRAPVKPLNGTNGSHTPPVPAGNGRMRTAPGVAAAKFEDPATVSEGEPFAEPPKLDEVVAPVATKPMPHLKSVGSTSQTGPNDAFLDQLAKERNERKAAQALKDSGAKPKLSLAALEAASTEAPTAVEPPAPSPMFPTAPSVPDARGLEADDDMEIGEVSRVVNLADLVRQGPKRAATANPANRSGAIGRVTSPMPKLGATGAVPKINATGAVPRINATGGVALIDAVDAVPSGLPAPLEAPAEPEKHSHRGLYILLAGAAVLLGAAAVILVLVLNSKEDVTGLGGQYEYNTERPDLIVRRPGDPGPGSMIEPPQNPFIPKQPKQPPRPPTQGSAKAPVDPPLGNSLKSDEVEAMARSTSSTTTACFRRASKGADDIILSDVKKIRVAFKVNPDGTVAPNSVDLSEKRSATLSSCLSRMVAGWKFRPNAGGDFGFILAKPD